MTREEHLKFCSICTKRRLNLQVGLVCDLTNEKADFEGECDSFELDEEEQTRLYEQEMEAAGDGETGDPKDFEKNKGLGGVIFCFGLAITILSHAAAANTGFIVIAYGAVFWGLIMHFRGREQEKIFKEHEANKKE